MPEGTQEPEEVMDELGIGATLMRGQYTIEGFLNAGGFGITYTARDSLDRRVVIKECFPGAFCRRSRKLVHARSRGHTAELKSIVRLFIQEARSLSKLDHPNIVGVHQVFEENNTAYMALDHVEGEDLLRIIETDPRRRRLSPVEIDAMLRKLLHAIGFIHARGILHRDISPDNIIVDSRKEPILIDFGAAREQATRKGRPLSALLVVKDGYSPQEFYVTGGAQGPSSDLYALAATFHHLISGAMPPSSQVRLSAMAGGEPDPFVPLLGRISGYGAAFLAALDQAMALSPKARIASAGDWLQRIDGSEPPAAPTRLASLVGVAGGVRGLAAVGAGVAALGIFGWVGLFDRAPEAPAEPSTAGSTLTTPEEEPRMAADGAGSPDDLSDSATSESVRADAPAAPQTPALDATPASEAETASVEIAEADAASEAEGETPFDLLPAPSETDDRPANPETEAETDAPAVAE
ncbi:MAG: protein kinase, partial [Pseudomonadota bacterium]